jgi:hypothetical protein
MSNWIKWAAGGLALATASGASAAIVTFPIAANGTKEVNAAGAPAGDPNGAGTGTLTLDSGTGGTTGVATFNLTFAGVSYPFTGYHIHKAPPTTTGSIVLDFQGAKAAELIRNGDTFNGQVTGLSSSTIDTILADPGSYYLNFHNDEFRPGAVRDQLPEPGSLGALCLGGLMLRRRRRAQ